MPSQADNLHRLPERNLPTRLLYTGYLLVIGVGLLMAGAQILLTHGMADGKFGISLDDIVYSYYGNRSNSKLETKFEWVNAGQGTDRGPPGDYPVGTARRIPRRVG